MRKILIAAFLLVTACTGTTSPVPPPSSGSSLLLPSASPGEATPLLKPEVVGQSFAAAKASLEAMGLTVTRKAQLSVSPGGRVLSQSISSGAAVSPGESVVLVVAKASLTPAGLRCPSNPLRGVYHPYRLSVLALCRWFVGTVVAIRSESDGDHHVDIAPDKGYGRYLDAGDREHQHGGLLIETMLGQKLPLPFARERVSVFGTWVYDTDHGWNEFHPVWAIKYLDTGRLVYQLPPSPPLYGSSSTTGGGGGAGNCDPSYPTVCIPPPPPDLDCGDIPYRNFTVLPPDPHGFDGDHDGIGCET